MYMMLLVIFYFEHFQHRLMDKQIKILLAENQKSQTCQNEIKDFIDDENIPTVVQHNKNCYIFNLVIREGPLFLSLNPVASIQILLQICKL